MKFFTLTKLGRTLLLTAVVAVGSVCWLGCGGDDDNSADNNTNNSANNNNNNNGGSKVDAALVNGSREAWLRSEGTCDDMYAGCEMFRGFLFKSNGEVQILSCQSGPYGTECQLGERDKGTFSTSGGVLTFVITSGSGNKETMTMNYSISGNTLTVNGTAYTKTGNLTIRS